MTYSQTIAKVFTIICYIMLIPAIVGLCVSFIFLPLALIPIVCLCAGIPMLLGYRKHSRGELSEGKIMPLWIGTAVFNFVLLIPQFLLLSNLPSFNEINLSIQSSGVFGSLYLSMVIWQMLAVVLSISAIVSEVSTNRNSGNVP